MPNRIGAKNIGMEIMLVTIFNSGYGLTKYPKISINVGRIKNRKENFLLSITFFFPLIKNRF